MRILLRTRVTMKTNLKSKRFQTEETQHGKAPVRRLATYVSKGLYVIEDT